MQAAFDVAPTWDGRAQAASATILRVYACVSGCVSVLEVQCPLLSKQQECLPLRPPPLLVGRVWARWRFYLIQGPDFKTGTMLLSLLFLSQL